MSKEEKRNWADKIEDKAQILAVTDGYIDIRWKLKGVGFGQLQIYTDKKGNSKWDIDELCKEKLTRVMSALVESASIRGEEGEE